MISVTNIVPTYKVSDIIYLQKRFVGDKAYKISFPYEGPYRVIEISGNTVKLQSLVSNKVKTASMRDIKIFKGSSLTKTNNKNIDKCYPIHQEVPNDFDVRSPEVEDSQVVSPQYNLRPRKIKDA